MANDISQKPHNTSQREASAAPQTMNDEPEIIIEDDNSSPEKEPI